MRFHGKEAPKKPDENAVSVISDSKKEIESKKTSIESKQTQSTEKKSGITKNNNISAADEALIPDKISEISKSETPKQVKYFNISTGTINSETTAERSDTVITVNTTVVSSKST